MREHVKVEAKINVKVNGGVAKPRPKEKSK